MLQNSCVQYYFLNCSPNEKLPFLLLLKLNQNIRIYFTLITSSKFYYTIYKQQAFTIFKFYHCVHLCKGLFTNYKQRNSNLAGNLKTTM